MKIRHILASTLLAGFAALGLVAGLKGARFERASAEPEPEKTWMVGFRYDYSVTSSWGSKIDFYQVHLEGTGVDQWLRLSPLKSGESKQYVTFGFASFTAEQTVTKLTFTFNQNDTFKSSVAITSIEMTEASHHKFYYGTMLNEWEGDNFKPGTINTSDATPTLSYNSEVINFVEDFENAQWQIKNKAVVGGKDSIVYMIGQQYGYDSFKSGVSTKIYTGGGDYFDFLSYSGADSGTVSLYLSNSNGNVGLIWLSLESDSYIYYFTGSSSATTHYIYSFTDETVSHEEQFGAFPGTQITSIPGVQEVQGVVQFQDKNQKVYKIPYNAGFFKDDHFIINIGSDADKSANLALVNHSSYYYNDAAESHNDVAAQCFELILDVEATRNAVKAAGSIKDYSICGVSQEDAATLLARYAAFSKENRETYIDSSKTYTYKVDKTEGEELVSFYDIFRELARIADQPFPSTGVIGYGEQTTAVSMVIVVAAVTVAIIAAGSVLILRRRKEN